jgi:hypothetical protein
MAASPSKHAIKSPKPLSKPIPEISAVQHDDGNWYINANGGQSSGFPFPNILQVSAMVYPTDAAATADKSPPAAAQPGNHAKVNGVEQYTFSEDNFNSIQVNKIDDGANFLQVWVQFDNGDGSYTLADSPAQFHPTSS